MTHLPDVQEDRQSQAARKTTIEYPDFPNSFYDVAAAMASAVDFRRTSLAGGLPACPDRIP